MTKIQHSQINKLKKNFLVHCARKKILSIVYTDFTKVVRRWPRRRPLPKSPRYRGGRPPAPPTAPALTGLLLGVHLGLEQHPQPRHLLPLELVQLGTDVVADEVQLPAQLPTLPRREGTLVKPPSLEPSASFLMPSWGAPEPPRQDRHLAKADSHDNPHSRP